MSYLRLIIMQKQILYIEINQIDICAIFFSNMQKGQRDKKNYMDYLVKTEQGDLFFIVDKYEQNNFYFRIVLCRENALPYIKKNGVLETLDSLLIEIKI